MQSIWREIAYYGRVLKELVFPRRCVVCSYGIETGYVCEQCRRNYLLQRVLKGEPREEYLAGQAEPVALDVLDSVLLLYKYDGVLKDALHRCKFAAEADMLPFLREEAEAGLPSAKLRWLEQFDIITCVPTSPERLAQRGFDVPQELIRNNYEKDVFNGDIGRVIRIVGKSATVDFPERPEGDHVNYTESEVEELQLAYAMSVHKSQGSEYPYVILLMVRSHYIMLQRNLLYTAVTRAKERVLIVGSKNAVRTAVENDKTRRRYSLLAERLQESSEVF